MLFAIDHLSKHILPEEGLYVDGFIIYACMSIEDLSFHGIAFHKSKAGSIAERHSVSNRPIRRTSLIFCKRTKYKCFWDV